MRYKTWHPVLLATQKKETIELLTVSIHKLCTVPLWYGELLAQVVYLTSEDGDSDGNSESKSDGFSTATATEGNGDGKGGGQRWER